MLFLFLKDCKADFANRVNFPCEIDVYVTFLLVENHYEL